MNHDCQPYAADCGLRAVTDLLAHTWDPVVLSALKAGPRRRRDLFPAIGGISDKTLTESLQRLTAGALIERTGDSTARAASYQLSPLGASLVHGPLAALGRWAVEHDHDLSPESTGT